jgi:hypothetical protein
MKRGTPYKEALVLTCLAMAGMAKEATPPPIETLEEITVPGTKDRARERGRLTDAKLKGCFFYLLRGDSGTRFKVSFLDIREQQISFRRESSARRLIPQPVHPSIPASAVRLEGNRLHGFDTVNISAVLSLDDNIDEADGIPASIPFGSHASLVNLDYLRLRDTQFQTHITVANGIDPQTRRCEEKFALLDDAGNSSNRLILMADSYSNCRRVERAREGDLVIADNVPEKLRQAVQDTYEPIAVRFANKLGSEVGQIFVAWWPDSPHGDVRFERSWNRNSLLLFNGTAWQEGLSARQREALWTTFATEQIQRRFRQADRPGALTESAAGYLLVLANAERSRNTSPSLAGRLPVWIAECAGSLNDRAGKTAPAQNVPGGGCGLLVQFVYDAVARSRSNGRETLYDTWRRLLNASYRRGLSGASAAEFLASSSDARRIVQGLLDGSADWNTFAVALDGVGVKLKITSGGTLPAVEVQSLEHFEN